MYEVSDITNYEAYKQCRGFLVSEPKKYIGTHVLFWAGAILYYTVTAFKTPPGLLVISIILNLTIQFFLLVLGFTDPGIIPKVLSGYENKQLRKIPLHQNY
jgi:hypothetical protein